MRSRTRQIVTYVVILRTGGAAADHPVHPHLPETAYLKAQILQLD